MNSSIIKYFLAAGLLAAVIYTTHAAWKTGDAAPDLAAFQLEGKLPSDLKGKVVLVDFWASWCGPCAQSFPVMEELQKKFGPDGLVIVAVSEDEKQRDMESFLKSHPVSFTVVRDARQKLVEKADAATMPSSFLFGRDGKLAYAHEGFHGRESREAYEKEITALTRH